KIISVVFILVHYAAFKNLVFNSKYNSLSVLKHSSLRYKYFKSFSACSIFFLILCLTTLLRDSLPLISISSIIFFIVSRFVIVNNLFKPFAVKNLLNQNLLPDL